MPKNVFFPQEPEVNRLSRIICVGYGMYCDLSALNHLSDYILLGLPVISVFTSFVYITDDGRGRSKV